MLKKNIKYVQQIMKRKERDAEDQRLDLAS